MDVIDRQTIKKDVSWQTVTCIPVTDGRNIQLNKWTPVMKTATDLHLNTEHAAWNTALCKQMGYVCETEFPHHKCGACCMFRGTRGHLVPLQRLDATGEAVLWRRSCDVRLAIAPVYSRCLMDEFEHTTVTMVIVA